MVTVLNRVLKQVFKSLGTISCLRGKRERDRRRKGGVELKYTIKQENLVQKRYQVVCTLAFSSAMRADWNMNDPCCSVPKLSSLSCCRRSDTSTDGDLPCPRLLCFLLPVGGEGRRVPVFFPFLFACEGSTGLSICLLFLLFSNFSHKNSPPDFDLMWVLFRKLFFFSSSEAERGVMLGLSELFSSKLEKEEELGRGGEGEGEESEGKGKEGSEGRSFLRLVDPVSFPVLSFIDPPFLRLKLLVDADLMNVKPEEGPIDFLLLRLTSGSRIGVLVMEFLEDIGFLTIKEPDFLRVEGLCTSFCVLATSWILRSSSLQDRVTGGRE